MPKYYTEGRVYLCDLIYAAFGFLACDYGGTCRLESAWREPSTGTRTGTHSDGPIFTSVRFMKAMFHVDPADLIRCLPSHHVNDTLHERPENFHFQHRAGCHRIMVLNSRQAAV